MECVMDSGGRKLGWMTSNGFRNAEFEPRVRVEWSLQVALAICLVDRPWSSIEDIVNLLLREVSHDGVG